MKDEWKDYDERVEKAFTILPQIVEKGVAEGRLECKFNVAVFSQNMDFAV